MAKNEKFLTVDIGATSIKLGEFEIDDAGQMTMTVFAYREYEEELSEETRMGVVEGVLRQMLLESGVKARQTLVSLSGQSALLRFGRISNMKNDKKQIRQLAEFEAKRNLPFALEDICLDYQLIAFDEQTETSNSLEVMSVVLKRDLVEQYTQAIRNVGLRPILIDLAPVACYNSARANGLGETSSSLVVSIGGRSTNLLFIEGNRFFARSIPIAGYSITQQIAKEFGIGLPEAEELKRHHGFVDLGHTDNVGATSEAATHIAKIIRNVMSRLHGEISRSINIYRSQQGGSMPTTIYLTGGSSILTYCDVFFSQKFDLKVEYFNPLTVVSLAPSIDREKLAAVAHMFGEVVGLAMRYVRSCPVEINLLPRKIMRQQRLSSKKPYFIAAMLCLLAMTFVAERGSKAAAEQSKERAEIYEGMVSPLESSFKKITGAISNADSAIESVDTLNKFLLERTKWPLIIEEIFRAKPATVWIDNITPIMGNIAPVVETTVVKDTSVTTGGGMGMMGGMEMMDDMSSMMAGADMGMGTGAQSVAKKAIAGFEISAHTITPFGTGLGTDPQLPPEPRFPFEVGEGDNSSDEDEEEDNSEDEEEIAESSQDSPNEAPQALDQSGEYLFVRNLRKSRLFSSDPTMTAMRTLLKSELFANGKDFEIQIKLEIPMEAYDWQFNNANRQGAMGGGGVGTGTGRSGRRRHGSRD